MEYANNNQTLRKNALLSFIILMLLACLVVPYANAWVFPPYQEIILFSPSITQGHSFVLQGTEPNATALRFWLIGPDTISTTSELLSPQSAFVYTLYPWQTRTMTPGVYHLVIQYAGDDGIFDIRITGNDVIDTVNESGPVVLFNLNTSGEQESSSAYVSLIDALNDPAVNDTYADYSIPVTAAPPPATTPAGSPEISIDPVNISAANNTITVSGSTTLAAGEALSVSIQHVPLAGIKCVSPGTFCGDYEGFANVTNGSPTNAWTINADTTSFWSGNYSVTVTSTTGGVSPFQTTFTSPVVIIPPTERSRARHFRMVFPTAFL